MMTAMGGTYEEQRPIELSLDDKAALGLTCWDRRRWTIVGQAKWSVLFETPIAHFLVRSFLADGVDEFLAHITTIEALILTAQTEPVLSRADFLDDFLEKGAQV